VHHVHIHIVPHGVQIYYSSCPGDVTPSIGNQQQPEGILVVLGKFHGEILELVVFVIGGEIHDHKVLLVGGEVEIRHSQASSQQVVHGDHVLEVRVDYLCVSDEGEVEEATTFGAKNIVVEVKIELIVHLEGSD